MSYSRLKSGFSIVPVGAMTRNASISSATSITIPAGANGILMQADTADVTYTIDGSTPSTTNGFILVTNDLVRLDLYRGAVVRVISATGAIRYQFFGTNI